MRGALYYEPDFFFRIEFKPERPSAEARAQGRGEKRNARRRGNECEGGERELYTARSRPLTDDDVEHS